MITKEEYINLLKECGMCTKKWTLAKRKMFYEKKAELIKIKRSKQKKSIFKNNRKGGK